MKDPFQLQIKQEPSLPQDKTKTIKLSTKTVNKSSLYKASLTKLQYQHFTLPYTEALDACYRYDSKQQSSERIIH